MNNNIENKVSSKKDMFVYAVMAIGFYVIFISNNLLSTERSNSNRLQINENDKKKGLMKIINNKNIGILMVKHKQVRMFGMLLLIVLFHEELLLLLSALK